ncbi:MAG: sugar ABC transporter substrate-binding protein [Phycisphaerales bacterium]|nr:sugar ABC transporter substrate-binding protein [Phycisphaerales bacterium]
MTARIALVVVVLLTAAALVPTTTYVPRADRVLFTVWGMQFEDRLFEDEYARGFETLNPGVEVEYRRYDGNSISEKYNAWHAIGQGPEVMRLMVTDYHQMVSRGMLEPLRAYIDDPDVGLSRETLDAIPPHLLDPLRIDGEIYALPEDNAQYGLYYNRSIFDAYNEAHPSDPIPYPDETWTWTTLRDAASRLTTRGADGSIDIMGIDLAIWQWPFMQFHAQAGGRLWSDDGLTVLIADDAGIEALEFLGALAFEDRSWEPYFGRTQGTGTDARFVTGRSAMLFDGSWRVPNFEERNPDLDFAVAPSPRGRVDAIMCGSCLWGMSRHADRKDLGWSMLRWLVEEPQAARYWDALRVAPPAHLGVVQSESFRSTSGIERADQPGRYDVLPMTPSTYEARAKWLEYAVTPNASGVVPGFVPTAPYQRALEDAIRRMLEVYLRAPGADARDLLEKATAEVHVIIDRDRSSRGLPPVRR